MTTTVVFLNHHTFLSLSNVVFYWAHSSTLTMGGADCAEGHPDTGAEWLTFIVGFAGFQLQLLNSVTLHVHMGVHVGASTQRTVHSVNVHPGREFNFTSKPLTKKHGEFPCSRLDPSRSCECIAVHWGFLFSAFISAAFSSCYEKLIFLLTLLEKDMSLCAPIQDNQVILVHMPPRISPPAPWPLSSAKSYLPSGLYGVSTRS